MMKFSSGDRVKIVCSVVGTVKEDPTCSEFSILVDFDGQIARLPCDGTLMGLKCLRLVKEETETYEHP